MADGERLLIFATKSFFSYSHLEFCVAVETVDISRHSGDQNVLSSDFKGLSMLINYLIDIND